VETLERDVPGVYVKSRDRVITTVRPRVAFGYPARRIPTAAENAIFVYCAHCIVGTGWGEAALGAHIWTQRNLVEANKEQCSTAWEAGHAASKVLASFTNNCLNSIRTRKRELSVRQSSFSRYLINTSYSKPPASQARKTSRTRRFTRLRATAVGNSFFGAEMAKRAPTPANRPAPTNWMSKDLHWILRPRLKTRSTPALCKRLIRGKPCAFTGGGTTKCAASLN